jgi:cation transport ATPase
VIEERFRVQWRAEARDSADVAIEARDPTPRQWQPSRRWRRDPLRPAPLRAIKGNLFWAFANNVAALPLAGERAVTGEPGLAGWRGRSIVES